MHTNGIPVEVLGFYGEYYPAFITDIHSHDCVTITYAHELDSRNCIKSKVHPSSLRMTPNCRTHEIPESSEIIVGQEVEVLVSEESSKPKSWWRGIVHKSKGCFAVVNLSSNLNAAIPTNLNVAENFVPTTDSGCVYIPLPDGISVTEVVENNQIRIYNHHPNLSPESLHKRALYIPSDYQETCYDEQSFEPLLEHCGAPCLVTIAPEGMFKAPEGKFSLMVTSTQSSIVQKASLIQNSFTAYLQNRVQLIKQNKDLTKRLEEIRTNKALFAFVSEFTIPAHLSNRITEVNLHKAQSINGVTSVNFKRDTNTMRITGSCAESVKRAREMLEFASDNLLVPGAYVNRLTPDLQNLVDKVGLGSLNLVAAGEFADFRLVGTRSAINDVKMVLNFQILGLRELDRLRGVKEPPFPPVETTPEKSDSNNQEEVQTNGHQTDDNADSNRNKNRKPKRKSATKVDQPNHPNGNSHDSVESAKPIEEVIPNGNGKVSGEADLLKEHPEAGDGSQVNGKRVPKSAYHRRSGPPKQTNVDGIATSKGGGHFRKSNLQNRHTNQPVSTPQVNGNGRHHE